MFMSVISLFVFILLGIFVLIELGLMITALVLLFTKGCKNLNQTAWALIIIFVQVIGPIVFMAAGMKLKDKEFNGDEYD
jgi:hypothetical protein